LIVTRLNQRSHVSAVGTIVLVLIALAGAAPTFAETSSPWSAAVELGVPAGAAATGGATLLSVSCAAAGSCGAVGSYEVDTAHRLPMAISRQGSAWQPAVTITLPGNADSYQQNARLEQVSCSAPGYCAAIGMYEDSRGEYQAMAVSELAGSWGAASEVGLPEGAEERRLGIERLFNSISCSGPVDCAAVGQYYEGGNEKRRAMFATSVDGVWQSRATRAQLPEPTAEEPGANLKSVSCWAPGSCSAVGFYKTAATPTTWRALVIAENGGAWTPASQPPLPAGRRVEQDELVSVVCLGPGNREATGALRDEVYAYGMAARERNGVWQQGVEVVPPPGTPYELTADLSQLACSGEEACVAAGYRGVEETLLTALSAGQWGREQLLLIPGSPERPQSKIRGIACTPAAFCTAIGDYEELGGVRRSILVIANASVWNTSPSGVTLPPDATAGGSLNAISCSAGGNCDAVGGFASGAASGHSRPMAISLGEPPAPAGSGLHPGMAPVSRTSSLAVLASTRIGDLLLRLLGPRQCSAIDKRMSLTLTASYASPRHRGAFKVRHVSLFIDGGRRTRVLVGKGRHRRRAVVYRPQFQSARPTTFSFVPAKLHAHRGRNKVTAVVTLARYQVVHHRRVRHVITKRLRGSFSVC
jgi:hypothetical protein